MSEDDRRLKRLMDFLESCHPKYAEAILGNDELLEELWDAPLDDEIDWREGGF